jgi:preprotein translocase SecE subunit
VARNRQRAKQRQAERRAKRLSEEDAPLGDPTAVEPSPAVDAELATGAPPSSEGRSDAMVPDRPRPDDLDELDEDVDPELELEAEEAGALASVDGEDFSEDREQFAPRGRRGDGGPEPGAPTRKGRGRVVQFLVAVWAELQRVQWPNRQALTTLTGVVLGFVLLAGGYLGALDSLFSRLINAIL